MAWRRRWSALGVVVARLLMSLVDSLGFRIPTGDSSCSRGRSIYAFAVGLFVTVGAALWPASGGAHPAGRGDQ